MVSFGIPVISFNEDSQDAPTKDLTRLDSNITEGKSLQNVYLET